MIDDLLIEAKDGIVKGIDLDHEGTKFQIYAGYRWYKTIVEGISYLYRFEQLNDEEFKYIDRHELK